MSSWQAERPTTCAERLLQSMGVGWRGRAIQTSLNRRSAIMDVRLFGPFELEARIPSLRTTVHVADLDSLDTP